MHALYGNTTSPTGDTIRTAFSNTIQLHAGGASAKRGWLEEQIELYKGTAALHVIMTCILNSGKGWVNHALTCSDVDPIIR